ncbi:MAG: alternate-type signal peptide domain-containing protein [Nocardioidaceae bacterium]|nr:alternate-type signal peptide domain-containing protein [Nocardioidaceae bacterium]MCL2612211.1 alternate-type signal peptide domain-containing protein [Nocardioidaceae bacterium]
MKKTTKGAIAASGAAVLLMGGAGTLAYWTGSQTVAGTSITSGELKLGAPSCGGWVYDGTSTSVTNFVPGDVVSETCTFGITAIGDNLSAKVTAPASVSRSGTDPTSASATVAATYSLSGAGGASGAILDKDTITSADNAKTLTAVIKVSFPFGTDESASKTVNANDTQSWTASLDDLTVSLTQIQTAANPAT